MIVGLIVWEFDGLPRVVLEIYPQLQWEGGMRGAPDSAVYDTRVVEGIQNATTTVAVVVQTVHLLAAVDCPFASCKLSLDSARLTAAFTAVLLRKMVTLLSVRRTTGISSCF